MAGYIAMKLNNRKYFNKNSTLCLSKMKYQIHDTHTFAGIDLLR